MVNKIINRLKVNIEAIKNNFTPLEISEKTFVEAIKPGTIEKFLHQERYSNEAKFFLEKIGLDNTKKKTVDKTDLISFILKKFPIYFQECIKEADTVCNHIFDLLGSGPIKIKASIKSTKPKLTFPQGIKSDIVDYEPIDWHYDFKTGYRWNPRKYYKIIEIPYGKADIKVPWELSRFQHLIFLGQAYRMSGNERYVQEFVNQIDDWIESNPPERGVNWRCTMDVAIRVCNWIAGYSFFKGSKGITEEFLLKFLKSILTHGRHIRKNLEYGSANHYLSDIVGLLYIAITFPMFKEAEGWGDFAIRELIKEMRRQIYEDGCDFESSTYYHRLVLEIFFFATILVVKDDKDFTGENYKELAEKIFGGEYVKKLYKMLNAVLYLLKPDGKMPQIGDNDNGRLHILGYRDIPDMRYLLTFGAILFKEPRFKIKEFGFCEEGLWIFGKRGYDIWQELEENCLKNLGDYSFPDAGWYVLRRDKDYMIISCGPNGQNGKGGHCHNDKLSFELCLNGEDIIIDSGTYVYTSLPEERNKFRATSSHNTVVIDTKEQNRFNGLFGVQEGTFAESPGWEGSDEENTNSCFIGTHRGYSPIVHKRGIFLNKAEKMWEIKDTLTGNSTKSHFLRWYFHLAPDVRIEGCDADKSGERGIILTKNGFKINISYPEALDYVTKGSEYSSGYGTKKNNQTLEFSCRSYVPVDIVFRFREKD